MSGEWIFLPGLFFGFVGGLTVGLSETNKKGEKDESISNSVVLR